jgi:tRNA(adenine34) deaminase
VSREATDAKYMAQALALALEAGASGEVPVGAVVVCDDRVVATAANAMKANTDATQHAELRAIQAAIREVGDARLSQCTLYVTLEPCAMCAGAIVLARVGRIVFGAWDDKAGMAGSVEDLLRHRKLNHRPEVQGGVLGEASGALLADFFRARR